MIEPNSTDWFISVLCSISIHLLPKLWTNLKTRINFTLNINFYYLKEFFRSIKNIFHPNKIKCCCLERKLRLTETQLYYNELAYIADMFKMARVLFEWDNYLQCLVTVEDKLINLVNNLGKPWSEILNSLELFHIEYRNRVFLQHKLLMSSQGHWNRPNCKGQCPWRIVHF